MHVYFITRLPRMEGGTSYVGFHGGKPNMTSELNIANSYKRIIYNILIFIGPWRSIHIDDLRQSKDIVSDIKTLQNMTISQMFETKTDQPEGKGIGSFLFQIKVFSVLKSHILKIFFYSHGGG